MTRVIDTICDDAFEVLQLADYAGQAENVIQDAHMQAKRIIEDSKSIAQTLQREASERGYQEGFTCGKSHGYTDGCQHARAELETELKAQCSELSDLMQEILDKTKAAYESQLQQQSKKNVELAVRLAEKIVGHVAVNDINSARENMRKALELVSFGSQITVKVNPSQFDQLRESLDEFSAVLNKHGSVKIIPDASVTLGGVLAESEGGRIDATVESQFENVKKAILGLNERNA